MITSHVSDMIYPSKKIGIFTILVSLILGISHGLADGAAGFLLASLPRTMSLEQASVMIIIYNILGFGYQPLVGMLTDKLKCYRLSVCIGLCLLLLALLLGNWQIKLAVIFAGIGSAAFHVGGGALALAATPNCTIGPGLFAAPGVVGLAIGAVLGLTGYSVTLPLVLLLGLTISILAIIEVSKLPKYQPKLEFTDMGEQQHFSIRQNSQNLKSDDWNLLVLVSAIALISTVWTSYQFLLQTHVDLIITLAVAAAIAKVLGGILAEKWGWWRWTRGSLIVAIIMLLIPGQNHLPLILGLALLQSTIPITLTATAGIMPQQPATASGFALGIAIILGGIPVVVGLSEIAVTPVISALIVVVTLLFLRWELGFRG